MTLTTTRALAGEFLGSALLTAVVIGSGIAAQTLSPSDIGFWSTIGRAFSDTFAGIAPTSVPPFIGAQVVGAALGWALVRSLFPVRAPEPAVAGG